MVKYIFIVALIMSLNSFAMNSAHNICGIDFNLIQYISRKVRTKANKLKVTYCADFATKQQLVGEKISNDHKEWVCCNLTMNNGFSLSVIPLDDSVFELLEAKYHEMH